MVGEGGDGGGSDDRMCGGGDLYGEENKKTVSRDSQECSGTRSWRNIMRLVTMAMETHYVCVTLFLTSVISSHALSLSFSLLFSFSLSPFLPRFTLPGIE